jgi:hypothetical protein
MTSVLAVGDDELVWETMTTRRRKLPRVWARAGVPRNSRGWATGKPGSGLPALPGDRGKNK